MVERSASGGKRGIVACENQEAAGCKVKGVARLRRPKPALPQPTLHSPLVTAAWEIRSRDLNLGIKRFIHDNEAPPVEHDRRLLSKVLRLQSQAPA
jgi:hypothetical protein